MEAVIAVQIRAPEPNEYSQEKIEWLKRRKYFRSLDVLAAAVNSWHSWMHVGDPGASFTAIIRSAFPGVSIRLRPEIIRALVVHEFIGCARSEH